MAKPIAYFGFSKDGSTIKFINNSLNSPTLFEWDFGDGNKSTEKNPIHTYIELGSFSVTLVAKNDEGSSEPTTITIMNTGTEESLNAPIIELIDYYLPSSLHTELNATEKISLIMKWQIFLQPLVWTPFKVEKENTHNEISWPALVNALIAQLVTKDIIIQGANQFVSTVSKTTDIDIDNGNEGPLDPTNKDGQIKSIETGPAKTEWYEDKSAVETSEILKNRSQAFANATKAGGAIDILNQTICQLAHRVMIQLEGCTPLEITTGFRIVKTNDCGCGHNANPFSVDQKPVSNAGITKRMI